MIDLSLFFNTIDTALYTSNDDLESLIAHLDLNIQHFPYWKTADLAIIGIIEDRGTELNKGVKEGANAIRKHLYKLKKGTGEYNIVDLGNLRPGIELNDTYLRIKEVCEALLDNNTIPIILGGSHDMLIGQFWAYEHLDRIISIANVDAYLNLNESSKEGMCHYHLMRILMHSPNYLFNLNQIGLQRYLNNTKSLETIEKMHFHTYPIGVIREDINQIEPAIREADIFSIDLTAVRMEDAPGNAYAEPFGLTGEELCQMCWYAGLSDKTTSFGLYEINPSLDIRGKTAKMASIAIWYFIEGFYQRRHEVDFENTDAFQKYLVNISDYDNLDLVFYKQLVTNKWWIEVPYPDFNTTKEDALEERDFEEGETCIIPCSYKDYTDAIDGELPTRWLNTHSKLL